MKKTAETSQSKKKNILIALLAIGVGYGSYAGWKAWAFQTTDDAQVEGQVVPVNARIGGYVDLVKVINDQKVKAGDTLAVMDTRELKAKLAQAQAELLAAQAGSQKGIAGAGVTTAEAQGGVLAANILGAQANVERAQADLKRTQDLFKQGIASQAQLEVVQTNVKNAQSALLAIQNQNKVASSNVVGAKAQVRLANARVLAAQAAIELLQIQIHDAMVRAPVSGVVAKKNLEVGQLLSPGQPLLSIVSDEKPWIVANFKETQIHQFKEGMPAEVIFDALPEQKFAAQIQSIQAATGSRFALIPADNATGNFTKVVQRVPVRIRLLDNVALGQLRPGYSAEISIRVH